MKKNKKGFGLVMAIMIITVLIIMAAGFFQVTDYSTKSTIRNAERLSLYWAAESASNFNVNWWVNQPPDVRVLWNQGYEWDGSKSTYPDINSYAAAEDRFPNAKNTSKLGKYYLHASSITEFGKNPKVGKYEIITARYKSERKPRLGETFPVGKEEAVWILDSYAYDPASGQIANITLSNVFNSNMDLGLLNNSEAIVYSFWSGGFNGKLSSFSRKDVRYGQCYYGSMLRVDPYSDAGTNIMNKFFQGPVLSSAFKRAGDTEARSRWGNNTFDSQSLVTSTTTPYRYGLGYSANQKSENIYLSTLTTVMDNGLAVYEGKADIQNTSDITWTWNDVVSQGVENGLFLLPAGTSDITIYIKPDSDGNTIATINYSGKTETKILGPSFTGVGVPAGYGKVSIEGISNKDFTLVTEKSQVEITGDFYISQMQKARDNLQMAFVSSQSTGAKGELKKLFDAMNALDPATPKLGIISSLGLSGATDWLGDPPVTFNSAKDIFCTSAIITNNGSLEALKATDNGKFVNVGSMITLGEQDKEQNGTSSHTYTKALVQDPRYLKDGVTYPGFFGPGPSSGVTVAGLNPQNVWSKQTTQVTKNWKDVVWRPIGGGTPTF
jgi:hypothetical protein